MKPAGVGALLKSCSYGLKYVIGRHVLGKSMPLIRGLVLTNRCNLRCRHCRVDARDPAHLDFAEAVAAIDAFHREGGRRLYLEGGEPFLWRDGQRGLDDLVDYAHGLGFLTVVVYTNGTLPIRTSADTVFVSVDGLLCAFRNDWKRPVQVCSVYEKGVVHECCRFSRDAELCRDCGYLSYAEIDQTLKLKPSALFNALKYF